MRRRPLVISLVVILVGAFGSLLASVIAGNQPQLGLDLQGGASVTLRPVGDYDTAALDVVPDIYRSRIDSLGVAEPEIIRQGDTIVVNLPGVKDKERAIELIGVTGKVVFRPVTSVLPLAAPLDESKIPTESATTTTLPGTETTVIASDTTVAGADTTVDAADTTVAPADTTAESTDTTASAPVTQGFATPRAATSTTAPSTTAPSTTTDSATTTTPAGSTTVGTDTTVPGETATTIAGETTTTVAFEPESIITPAVDDLPEASVLLPDQSGTALYQLGPAFALGENAIDTADATLVNGEWTVEMTLKSGPLGMDAWNAMTATCYAGGAECAQGGMAIVLDHRVISAPAPQVSFFSSNTVVISGGGGGFGESEAADLARVLKYGSTPIEMKAEAAQTVSATLGKDSLRAGIIAGIVGILLVLLLMLAYYRSLAGVVVAGLCVTGAILYSIVSLLSRTSGLALTLAGVTGIIVSIGVTIDSYVVFFERLKDEVRSGRSFRSSAQRGFTASWRTILAADTVSLIGASVLWYLSVGGVRGFAFFLGLSTLCDMVVAYFFTRPAVLLLSRSKRYQGNQVLGVTTGEAFAGGAA